MRRTCGQCGTSFEGKTTRARYCSARCRVAANRLKESGVAQVVELPKPRLGQSLTDTVRESVAESTSDLAPLAVLLARRIESSESEAGAAALSKELRATLTAIAAERPAHSQLPVSRLDQFRARRASADDA